MTAAKTQFLQLKDGSNLAYQVHNQEAKDVPLVMITGMSAVKEMWFDLPRELATSRPVLVFDNRAMGESRVSAENESSRNFGISLAAMAQDTAALIDHLGWDTVDVLGWSMGGMIAQTLALDNIERTKNDDRKNRSFKIRSLILCGSSPSDDATSAFIPVLREMFKPSDPSPKEKMKLRQEAIKLAYKMTELNFSKEFVKKNPEVVKYAAAEQLRYRIPVRVIQQQSASVRGFDARPRLHLLAGIPTLIVHGTEDYVLPYTGAREFLKLIPGSVEAKLSHSAFGHYFFKEVSVAKVIDEFLVKQNATKTAVQAKL